MCTCSEELKQTKKIAEEYNIPFVCKECGAIKFQYQAIRDIVFIFPARAVEKIGNIIIPEAFRQDTEFGVVLSFGPGYYSESGKYCHSYELKIGAHIIYDKQIPWIHYVASEDGKKHKIKYMGYQDIKGIIVDSEV